jgi:cyclophilin family peptidyl-prolyl cis-trans isomerase
MSGTKPQAVIHTKRGLITLELFADEAPLTVDNFVTLARKGFFNGLTFHRVVPNFVIQGGDPRADGEGGPGYQIRCEINQQPYKRGTVGMALSGKDTGGSQFFITHAPQPHLDGGYTVFGQVVTGMEVVDQITRGDVIEKITIVLQ